ncbi:MAG: hypothetical protein GSR73_00785 [Desulfurococcales archaeon]|nr:hypothetical protein [Desulfurococcales archaeon]
MSVENATLALVMKGSKINLMLATSPLMITVYAVTILPLIGLALYYRGKPGGNAKAKLLAIALIAVVIIYLGVSLATAQWNNYYGVWVEDETIRARYYGGSTFEGSLCKVNITLTTVDQARKLLSIRTNGVSDPSLKLYMGHFKLKDGSKGDILILGEEADGVIIISKEGEKLLVGLPGTRDFYHELVELRGKVCG